MATVEIGSVRALLPLLRKARWRRGVAMTWETRLPDGTTIEVHPSGWSWRMTARRSFMEVWTVRQGEDRTLDRAMATLLPVITAA